MKKLYMLLFTATLTFLLVACDANETAKNKPAETGFSNDFEELTKDYDEVIADTDSYKITLTKVEKQSDVYGEPTINLYFEIENLLADKIEPTIDTIILDGEDIGAGYLFEPKFVDGNSTETAKITIRALNDEELPPGNDSLETNILMTPGEDINELDQHAVKITF